MEVSMSKTRRGKYTDNRICYISKCKGDMRLYLRRKGKLPCFSYLVRGKSFSFYRGKIGTIIMRYMYFFSFFRSPNIIHKKSLKLYLFNMYRFLKAIHIQNVPRYFLLLPNVYSCKYCSVFESVLYKSILFAPSIAHDFFL